MLGDLCLGYGGLYARRYLRSDAHDPQLIGVVILRMEPIEPDAPLSFEPFVLLSWN